MTVPNDPNQEAIRLLELEARLAKRNKLDSFYPDIGDLRRSLYEKHIAVFRAGADHRERAFLAANRVGKSEGVGGYETVLHLTGRYPDWWEGRRFSRPITAWAAGDSAKTTRDIIQRILLGPIGEFGTGLIPADLLVRTTAKPGVADAIEGIFVKHTSGGVSELLLKSFDQGREAYQGANRDWVWLDEEVDRPIYVECLLRTMTTNGLLLVTFTPLLGMTELCRDFLSGDGGKFCVQATWNDCPHLSESAKAELLASIPPYQRKARSQGVPALGSGAVYQVPEEEIVIADFEIPAHYPRSYGLDVGWNKTAAVWAARDNATSIVYLYSEYARGMAEPVIHAKAIMDRGKWIQGVIDPAAQGRSQVDGRQLLDMYSKEGLRLEPADNAVETGIYKVWQMLSTGKLKIFRSLGNWLEEFRLYQRDEDGRIIKGHDHLLDATRYLILSGLERMRVAPVVEEKQRYIYSFPPATQRWMQ